MEGEKVLRAFQIEKELWYRFIQKYGKGKASAKLREFIRMDLKATPTFIRIHRDDLESLKARIFSDDKPIQLVGKVGIGKTTCVKRLIESDKEHIYIVFDCHNEYDFLPEIQLISFDLKESARIRMPEQVSASKGLFPVYHNQILSRKFPPNWVIVVEEAHRYKEMEELLKEGRKFVKLIAICQKPIGDFCPVIEIVD